MNQLQNWLASSQDPTKVSRTVEGVIVSASSAIVFFAMTFFHLNITAGDVGTLATGIGMVAGSIAFIAGLLRKGAVAVGRVK